jgi:hypothetical protein
MLNKISKIVLIGMIVLAFPKQSLTGQVKLEPGIWTNITPAHSNPATDRFVGLALDPGNPGTMYVGQETNGIWKSTDGGSTWVQLGDPDYVYNYESTTKNIQTPCCIAVDPKNPQHLYCSHGGWGKGNTGGFWESTDGGVNWKHPSGFEEAMRLPGGSTDVGKFDVDPNDFKHVLIGLRYIEKPIGFWETKDGGVSFIVHPMPFSYGGSTPGINFLCNPSLGIGNSSTWILSSEGPGFWRTTDAGAHWTQVSATLTGIHGGINNMYYTKSGVLYYGGTPYPTRSTDNGITWQEITSNMYGYYSCVCGDGNYIYQSSQGNNVNMMRTAESDGTTWAPMAQLEERPWFMVFDAVNRIMYTTNGNSGVWALKSAPLGTTTLKKQGEMNRPGMQKLNHQILVGNKNIPRGGVHDISGRSLDNVKCFGQAVVIKRK